MSLLYYSVLGSAFFCFIYTTYLSVKLKQWNILIFPLFYLSSFFVSFYGGFLDKNDSHLLIFLFHNFDIIFFLLYVLQFHSFINKKNDIRLLLFFLIPIQFLIYKLIIPVDYSLYIYIFFDLLILYLTIPFFIAFIKEKKNIASLTQHQFFFLSAFFFFSFITLLTNLLILFVESNPHNLVFGICLAVNYLAWIIKYFILLYSVICKLK